MNQLYIEKYNFSLPIRSRVSERCIVFFSSRLRAIGRCVCVWHANRNGKTIGHCRSAIQHFDLVKSRRSQRRDFREEIIIAGWVGEKSRLERTQENEEAALLLNVGAIPAMGYIPGVLRAADAYGIGDRFPTISLGLVRAAFERSSSEMRGRI